MASVSRFSSRPEGAKDTGLREAEHGEIGAIADLLLVGSATPVEDAMHPTSTLRT